MDAPCEADAGPTHPICCPHGQLLPEQASGAKRMLVPENLWLFFYEDALRIKPDDALGCPTFPMDSAQCSQCSNELSEVACLEDSLRLSGLSAFEDRYFLFASLVAWLDCNNKYGRERKNKQRKSHEKLAAAKSIPLSPHCTYYLLPASWIVKWRNYVNTSSKNISSTMEPESLDIVIDQLKCEVSR